MISQLKRLAKKANINLDHYHDSDGIIHYKWSVEMGRRIHTTTQVFDTFEECVSDMIQHVTTEEQNEERTNPVIS